MRVLFDCQIEGLVGISMLQTELKQKRAVSARINYVSMFPTVPNSIRLSHLYSISQFTCLSYLVLQIHIHIVTGDTRGDHILIFRVRAAVSIFHFMSHVPSYVLFHWLFSIHSDTAFERTFFKSLMSTIVNPIFVYHLVILRLPCFRVLAENTLRCNHRSPTTILLLTRVRYRNSRLITTLIQTASTIDRGGITQAAVSTGPP